MILHYIRLDGRCLEDGNSYVGCTNFVTRNQADPQQGDFCGSSVIVTCKDFFLACWYDTDENDGEAKLLDAKENERLVISARHVWEEAAHSARWIERFE